MNTKLLTILAIGTLVLQGCATAGYDRSLVSNSSNLGLNVNSGPGKVELALSKEAGGMTPTFEGGQTLPIISSMTSTPENKNNFLFGRSSTFATGDAAYTMTYLYTDCNKSVAPIKSIPDVELSQKPQAVPGPGEVKPAVFMTNFSTGASLNLGRVNDIAPNALSVGYNRQERVSAPVSVEPSNRGSNEYVAGTPSLIATLDNWTVSEGDSRDGGAPITHLQHFVSGAAADNLALRSDIRRIVLKRIAPELDDSFCEDNHETRSR